MEEHVRTEPELSEEQLQEITGGCGQCMTDARSIAALKGHAGRFEQQAAHALQAMRDGKTVGEIEAHSKVMWEYQHRANANREQIATLEQRIIARHAGGTSSSRT